MSSQTLAKIITQLLVHSSEFYKVSAENSNSPYIKDIKVQTPITVQSIKDIPEKVNNEFKKTAQNIIL